MISLKPEQLGPKQFCVEFALIAMLLFFSKNLTYCIEIPLLMLFEFVTHEIHGIDTQCLPNQSVEIAQMIFYMSRPYV